MTKISEKGIEKAAEALAFSQHPHMERHKWSDKFQEKYREESRSAIAAYLDVVEGERATERQSPSFQQGRGNDETIAHEAPASAPAPDGWRMVPVEPDEMQIVQMRDAFKATRVSGIGGQTTDATFAFDYAREIAAYRAAVAAAPEPPVSDVRLDRTYAWSEAAAFRAGQIAQAEADARIVENTKTGTPTVRFIFSGAIRNNAARLRTDASLGQSEIIAARVNGAAAERSAE